MSVQNKIAVVRWLSSSSKNDRTECVDVDEWVNLPTVVNETIGWVYLENDEKIVLFSQKYGDDELSCVIEIPRQAMLTSKTLSFR